MRNYEQEISQITFDLDVKSLFPFEAGCLKTFKRLQINAKLELVMQLMTHIDGLTGWSAC